MVSPRVANVDGVEASSFNSLYLAHFRALFDTAHRIIGNRQVSDQIAQAVLLDAWQSLPAIERAGGSVAGHLRMMTVQRTIDWARSNSTRSPRELRLVQDPGADQESTVVADEQRLVWDALARLPTEQRQPIVLALYACMSYREIAAHLALSEVTVRERIRTGMQALAVQVRSTKIA